MTYTLLTYTFQNWKVMKDKGKPRLEETKGTWSLWYPRLDLRTEKQTYKQINTKQNWKTGVVWLKYEVLVNCTVAILISLFQ